MKILYLIPARGGSKGLPGKNIKTLAGKPLITYTLDLVRKFADDQDICVSTDDLETIKILENLDFNIPFVRPAEIATDQATTIDVILHAINYYLSKGVAYDAVMLLQPTSPFRKIQHLEDVVDLYQKNQEADMVVSVKISKDNPYFNLFEETSAGFLQKSKPDLSGRRQDCPTVYAYNGSIYLIKISSLLKYKTLQFNYAVKYVMEQVYSIDIDTPLDWIIAEAIRKEIII